MFTLHSNEALTHVVYTQEQILPGHCEAEGCCYWPSGMWQNSLFKTIASIKMFSFSVQSIMHSDIQK